MTEDQAPMDPTTQEFPEETGTQQQERVDWKAEAIRAQARLEMLEQRGPQAQAPKQAPQLSETERLTKELEGLRSTMPALDPSKPNSFWDRENHKEKIDAVRERLMETRERERQQALLRFEYEQKSQQAVQNVKRQFSQRPGFKQAEARFDQMVSQVEPHVRADPNALTVMMKNILYDVEIANPQGQGQRPIPAAPGQGYAPQRGQPQQRKGSVEFQNEQHAAVANFWGMTAEEYYDPKYRERGPETEGNGVSFYPFKIGGRR